MLEILATVGLALAALPAALALTNLPLLRRPQAAGRESLPPVSILIPARNEQRHIERSVRAALASRGIDVEVLVMNDHSTDRTAEIVGRIAREDPRLRLLAAPDLPPGWAGKQHACHALAGHAAAPVLLFIDADVELAPDGAAQAVHALLAAGDDLTSGVPRQVTATPIEKLVIPLIHFVLLGYLPLRRMRQSRSPALAAGCGQLFAARREAYRAMGGHATIRATFHDGLQLPRAFRRAGFRTGLFDATRTASCRMYASGREVIDGLAKNAHEGLGGPVAIWIWSALLFGGHVLPAILAVAGAVLAPGSRTVCLAVAGVALAVGTRLVLAARFRQSIFGALLHPLGVALLIAIQWRARAQRRSGRAVAWKGRAPAPSSDSAAGR
jgi:hypothetical protein